MAGGAFTWFDAAIDKIAKNVIRLDTGNFRAILCASAQAIDPTFVGASGNCQYSDLTAQLATANGYTIGGVPLVSPVFSRAAGVVKFTADAYAWTLTGGLTYKYGIIFCDNALDDLLCFYDAETGGGSATPTAGTLSVTPHATSGIVGWHRV